MTRFTTYLLLASFLRLQTACCCVGGPECGRAPADDHSSAVQISADQPSGCPCGHRRDENRRGSSSDRIVERDEHHHKSPNHGCHLCVITHLKYVGPGAAIQLDHLAVSTYAPPVVQVSAICHQVTADSNSSLRHCSGSLLSCGSLLRI
jgi:hypothetical protein